MSLPHNDVVNANRGPVLMNLEQQQPLSHSPACLRN